MATGGPASAESRTPALHERVDDRFVEDPDPYVLDACGIAVLTEVHVWGQFLRYGDGTARQHLNWQITSRDPATGAELLTQRTGENFFIGAPTSETVDDETNTITLEYEAVITGLPQVWLPPGDEGVARDSGWVRLAVTEVIDLDTGETISFDEQVVDIHGPHPYLALAPDDQDAAFCEALTS